jgi:plasmid stability protein
MAQVLIRDLPDDVVERLKAKAAAEGSSLEAHLRCLLAEASGLDRSGFLLLADSIAATTAGEEHTDATTLIRADRDRDGR